MNKYVVLALSIVLSLASFAGGVFAMGELGRYRSVMTENVVLKEQLAQCAAKLKKAEDDLNNRGELVYQHTECEPAPTAP